MSAIPAAGNIPRPNPKLFKDDLSSVALGMGLTAENLVSKYKISREDQDKFALVRRCQKGL